MYILKKTENYLHARGITSPRREAEELMCHFSTHEVDLSLDAVSDNVYVRLLKEKSSRSSIENMRFK